MKKYLACFVLTFLLFGFTPLPSDCGTIFYFKEGSGSTLTHYDNKDKVTGSTKTTYNTVSKFAGGASASVTQENYDKKDKLTVKNDFMVKCENGVLYFDMKMFMPQQQAEAYKDMELEVNGTHVEYPSDLSVGKSLKDADIKFTIKDKAGNIMPMTSMNIRIMDRKVETKESITTPAGTFECYKITETTETKSIFTIRMKSTIWFNQEYGTIKTESYKENGKYMGRSEITSLIK